MPLYIEDNWIKCTNCFFKVRKQYIPEKYDLLQIAHTCKSKKSNLKYDRFKRPNIIKKGINFVKATIEHNKKGKKPTEETLHRLRLDICNSCDHGDNEHCFVCGCSIPLKAVWQSNNCPVHKWPKDMQDLLFRNKKPANLKDVYKNAGCFFIGSGPSLDNIDLNLLKERGILSFAVNNVGAYKDIRPNFWCSADTTSKFHSVIWDDPGIIKFVRNSPGEYPNLYTFQVNEDFNVKTFFEEPTVSFGNHTELIDEYKNKGGRSVMYCSLRIMHYLGVRRVYLLGCDFNMQEKRPYVFDQQKWSGGCKTNNQAYEIMNERFFHLNKRAKELNYHIYNCTENSKLTAFEKKDYYEAIKREKLETPASLAGMYG